MKNWLLIHEDPENLLEQKGRQLHEKLMLPIFLFGLGYTVINSYLGIWMHAASSALIIPFVFISWLINKKGFHYAAQVWTFIYINFIIFLIALLSHEEADVYLFYFPVALGAYLIFQGKHKITRTIVAIISLIGLSLTASMNFEGVLLDHLEEVDLKFERMANVFGTFIFLVIEVVYLINLNEKVQAILVEKQGVLDASLAKLKSSLYTRDKILSILAHDVRSPLSNINGLLELVENGGFNKEEEHELLKKLHEKTDVTLKMVEDVLRWSRLQQEAIVYTPELANGKDICELVNSVCKIYDDLIEKKQIVFNDCSAITSRVKLDRNMMESIIRNLLSNAIKFSDYDPKITITVREVENALLFQIKDKGKGMPKEDIEKLTAGISFTTDQKGTVKGIGLGNQIVMDFLKYHNSHIEVESEVGVGTTISFRIDTI